MIRIWPLSLAPPLILTQAVIVAALAADAKKAAVKAAVNASNKSLRALDFPISPFLP